MREYELTVVLHPDLEADLDSTLKKVRSVITDNGGNITKEDNWGKKKLAYRIGKEDFGIYICFDVELPAEAVAKVNGVFNITTEVLRFLLVSIDQKARKALAESKERESEAKQAQEEE